jgi:hypothetical protein
MAAPQWTAANETACSPSTTINATTAKAPTPPSRITVNAFSGGP